MAEMTDIDDYIDYMYNKVRPVQLPANYVGPQVEQTKILLESANEALAPQVAAQEALKKSVSEQAEGLKQYQTPQRDDLADAIMLLGAPLLGAFTGETGATVAPKAYAGASGIYEGQIKEERERQKLLREAASKKLEEDRKRMYELGGEISKGKQAAGKDIAQMELEKYKQGEKTKRAEILSPGQKTFDVEAAKESAKWLGSGGYASGKRDIALLDDALSQLSSGKIKSGGAIGLRSLAGKNIQDFTDSDWVTFENKIQGVFAGGLSKMLPGSITEKEREWFLSLSTNPRLSPEQNYDLIKSKRDRLADILESQKSAAEYTLKNKGSMQGFTLPEGAKPAPEFQNKDPKVENWAKEHGYSYDSAYELLKKRGAVK